MNEVTNNQSARKRAVAYVRVSTRNNSRKSLNMQTAAIEDYAKANGIEIIGWFSEVAKSAVSAQRRELQNLLKFVARNGEHIDYVLVYRISRLSRNCQSFCVDILSKLQPLGIGIRSATEKIDETPWGQFIQMTSISLAQISGEKYYKRTMLNSQTTD